MAEKQAKCGIAVAGSLIGDISNQIDTYPRQGLLANIQNIKYNVGGTGNMILDLAKLDSDLPIKVSGIVGLDEIGEQIMDTLSAYPNINVGNITRVGKSPTTQVMNALDNRQRTFFFYPGVCSIYNESYINWDVLDAKIFHLEYLLLMKEVDAADPVYGTHGAKILHDAKVRGMQTSVDMVSGQGKRALEIVPPALKYTDYCIINEVEAGEITGIPINEDGEKLESVMKSVTAAICDMGVSHWVVVHSPSGGYGYDCEKDMFIKVPSLDLPEGYIKGSTGAGDAYCSGILYGAYKEWPLKKSMQFATACAACSLSEENGTDGLRDEKSVWEESDKISGYCSHPMSFR